VAVSLGFCGCGGMVVASGSGSGSEKRCGIFRASTLASGFSVGVVNAPASAFYPAALIPRPLGKKVLF